MKIYQRDYRLSVKMVSPLFIRKKSVLIHVIMGSMSKGGHIGG